MKVFMLDQSPETLQAAPLLIPKFLEKKEEKKEPVPFYQESKNCFDQADNERFAFLGHSNQKELGDYNAESFVKKFSEELKHKNKSQVKDIYLIGCEIALSTNDSIPLAQKIADKLYEIGCINVKVHAVASPSDAKNHRMIVSIITKENKFLENKPGDLQALLLTESDYELHDLITRKVKDGKKETRKNKMAALTNDQKNRIVQLMGKVKISTDPSNLTIDHVAIAKIKLEQEGLFLFSPYVKALLEAKQNTFIPKQRWQNNINSRPSITKMPPNVICFFKKQIYVLNMLKDRFNNQLQEEKNKEQASIITKKGELIWKLIAEITQCNSPEEGLQVAINAPVLYEKLLDTLELVKIISDTRETLNKIKGAAKTFAKLNGYVLSATIDKASIPLVEINQEKEEEEEEKSEKEVVIQGNALVRIFNKIIIPSRNELPTIPAVESSFISNTLLQIQLFIQCLEDEIKQCNNNAGLFNCFFHPSATKEYKRKRLENLHTNITTSFNTIKNVFLNKVDNKENNEALNIEVKTLEANIKKTISEIYLKDSILIAGFFSHRTRNLLENICAGNPEYGTEKQEPIENEKKYLLNTYSRTSF